MGSVAGGKAGRARPGGGAPLAPTAPVGRQRVRAIRRVLLWTLGLNLAVALAKGLYGLAAGALAIQADALHSLTDGTANLVALVGVSLAHQPPDDDHPYGHHKLETIAAAVIGFALLVLAADLVRGAVRRLLAAAAGTLEPPDLGFGALWVLGGTLAVNAGVAIWERRAARRLGSAALESDARHTQADVLVTVGVLATVAFIHLGYAWLDAAAALAIAAWIAWAGVGIVRHNAHHLADAAVLDPTDVGAIAAAVPGVESAHKVRSRGTPDAVFVDLHIQIDPALDVVAAHALTHRVIDAIRAEHPSVEDVTIHTEPGTGTGTGTGAGGAGDGARGR